MVWLRQAFGGRGGARTPTRGELSHLSASFFVWSKSRLKVHLSTKSFSPVTERGPTVIHGLVIDECRPCDVQSRSADDMTSCRDVRLHCSQAIAVAP